MKVKPRILLICDVHGWAWWNKSLYLIRYLSDEFIFDTICLLGDKATRVPKIPYDLYMTYGYSFVKYVEKFPRSKIITGVTAHRPWKVLAPEMKKAGTVHANSMLLYKELKKHHNNVHYVPNGVDHTLFKPIKPIPEVRNNVLVGHVGKLSTRKGQLDFIEPAVKKAKADYIRCYKNYKNMVPLQKMVDIYQTMDFFIVASEEDGTPNPALEAAACGRPILSNKIGNMPEFIKDGVNGFLLNKRNIDQYVEKINWFRTHRKEMIQMGKKARETVEKEWTWKIQAERYRRMFRTALGVK